MRVFLKPLAAELDVKELGFGTLLVRVLALGVLLAISGRAAAADLGGSHDGPTEGPIGALGAPAVPADFRLVNIGDPCDSVRDLEAALGSTEVQYETDDPDYLEFRGDAFQHEARFIYNCADGRLVSGIYDFPPEEKEQAARTFKSVYDSLVAMYGAPCHDNTPWQTSSGAIERGDTPNDPAAYYTSWLTFRAFRTLDLARDNTKTPPRWLVSVSVSLKPLADDWGKCQ